MGVLQTYWRKRISFILKGGISIKMPLPKNMWIVRPYFLCICIQQNLLICVVGSQRKVTICAMNKISILLTLPLCFFCTTNMVAQGEFEENGINYLQNDDDYKTVRVTFHNYRRYEGDITIPTSVTHKDNTYKVTKIGRHAFRYSKNLKTVNIPNGVTNIDICAFAECDNLTTVTIPNSVKAIGDYSFANCI